MPSYVFAGPYPTTYPETRDVNGANLGTVEPGDIRIFDDPPADGWWVPEIPPRDDSGGDDEDPDPDGAGEDPGSEGAAGEPEPHDDEPDETPDPETEPGE